MFRRTREEFGGLSNMASGYDLVVNRIHILSTEALYQACRFPHLPAIQNRIIAEASPMSAKMRSKPFRGDSRADWDLVRVRIMRWCLRVKLAQNWETFGRLLGATGDRQIVEESIRDDFWGAKPTDLQTLVGVNVLGRLLMELRAEMSRFGVDGFMRVDPLEIPNFALAGSPILTVHSSDAPRRSIVTRPGGRSRVAASGMAAHQRTLAEWLLPDDEP